MDYVSNVGEVLLKLCSIAQMNNVNIQIFMDQRYGVDRNVFELRLNRGVCFAAEVFELDQIRDPAHALEYIFNRTLHNLKREIEKERTNNG